MAYRGGGSASGREEGLPSLTARKHWPRYLAGIAVETAYTLVLTLVALGLAVLAKVIWP